MRKSVVLFAAVVLLVGLGSPVLALSPAQINKLEEMGPYAVGFQDYLLTDTSRDLASGFGGRPIPVYVWYPVDAGAVNGGSPEAVYPLDPIYMFLPDTLSSQWEAYGIDPAYQAPEPSSNGPFPLLMFSPGWGGPAYAHLSIGARLASHGFVVAIVTHFGDATVPLEPFDHIAVASFNRPRDVSFALTHLLQWNEAPGHLLNGTVRPDEVAAGGWSLGGYAAMTLAGGDDSVCDKFDEMMWDPPAPRWTCAPTAPDPRIKVVVTLDGSNQVLYFSELARIDLPAMGMGQEWGNVESWQARQHAAFSGRPAYRVDVADTIHQSFSDICEAAHVLGDMGVWPPAQVDFILTTFCEPYMPKPEVTKLVSKYMTAFLKTNLEGVAGYQPLLTPGWALTRESHIEFFVTEKKSPKSIDQDWPDLFVYFPHQPGSAHAKAEKNPKQSRPIPHAGLVW